MGKIIYTDYSLASFVIVTYDSGGRGGGEVEVEAMMLNYSVL